MKKYLFVIIVLLFISQICFGDSYSAELKDKLGVSIIGSHIQRGKYMDVITATMVTPNNLPLVCTDTYVYGTVPVTLTLSSLQEVYIWSGGTESWTASSWGVTSPHSFSATFNTITQTIPTGPTTLYALDADYVYQVVANFMVTNSVPFINGLYPSSANIGTTATTWVYTTGVDATSTLVTDTTPFGLVQNNDVVTPTSWGTVCPIYGVFSATFELSQTMATGDWLLYMIFNQDDFRYNINRTFGVIDPTVTWAGIYGSCWNYANNWDPAGVPNSNSNVVIPSGVSNNPLLNEIGYCNNLEVNSGGQLSIPDYTLYVYNDLVNNGNIYQTGGNLALYGTITNTGTYAADGGTFKYASSTISQTINPSMNYYNLEASGANKVLGGNTSVYGITNLNGASIGIGNYDLTTYTGQFSQTTPLQDYIITNGTGALQYSSTGAHAVISGTFPIGHDANNYNPMSFDNNGVPMNWVSGRVQYGIVPSHPNSPWCLQRTWDVKCDPPPPSSWNATIVFEWSLSQENSLFTQARQNNNVVLNLCEYDTWQCLGPVSISSLGDNRYSLQYDNFIWISGCAAGDGDHTLPVELSTFFAVYTQNENGNNFVTVNWSTASETDVHGFNIYRSEYDDFSTVGNHINASIIPGHGSSSDPHSYSFEDITADVYTTNYYWLEVVDYDAIPDYHGPVKYVPGDIDGDQEQDVYEITMLLSNYPNPVTNYTTIEYQLKGSVLEQNTTIKIYNILGELIKTVEVSNNKAEIDVQDLSSGIYFYQLRTKNFSEIKKMLIIK
ncbi:MAG: T9SS type A sorting domain-containing protein [Candidatus Cloacimonetes bacterium]|nr:T9SS type A sorting domain-containing protein [Candidatus Cloacimonadota bacterium]